MSWHATDDKFPGHRKTLRLRRSPYYPHAIALWTLAGAWCCGQKQETFTGEVPFDVLATFGVPDWFEAAKALIEVGLWERADDDTARFHDWNDWNGIGGKEYRSKEQTRLRTAAYRQRRCEAGDHDRHCPSDSCPKKASRKARPKGSVTAGDATQNVPEQSFDQSGVTVGDATPGRARDGLGTGRGSGTTSQDKEQATQARAQLGDVCPHGIVNGGVPEPWPDVPPVCPQCAAGVAS